MTDEDNAASELMNALIGKMERMDSDLGTIRKENQQMRNLLKNPAALLKRAGFIRTETPVNEDLWGDPLRGSDAIVKGVDGDSAFDVPKTNQEYYDMDWDEIHNLAGQAKSLGHVSNISLPTGDAE
tara:strand:+ start:9793 stop:10170 length:378 start_codon:yes stop_codon:yes gene_type:complete